MKKAREKILCMREKVHTVTLYLNIYIYIYIYMHSDREIACLYYYYYYYCWSLCDGCLRGYRDENDRGFTLTYDSIIISRDTLIDQQSTRARGMLVKCHCSYSAVYR
jgi:hypothetical protein